MVYDNDKAFSEIEYSLTVKTLLMKGNMALEDREWEKAIKYFDEAIINEPRCAEGCVGKFLSERKSESLSDYFHTLKLSYSKDTRAPRIACNEAKDHIDDMIRIYAVSGKFDAEEIKKMYSFNRTFSSALADSEASYKKQLDEFENNSLLKAAWENANPELKTELEQGINSIVSLLKDKVKQAAEEDNANSAKVIAEYQSFIAKVDGEVAKISAERKSLSNDTKDKSASVTATATPKKKKKTVPIIISIVAAVLVIGGLVTYFLVLKPSMDYDKAVRNLESGHYEYAKSLLEEHPDYKNSTSLIQECDNGINYLRAEDLISAGRYDAARVVLNELGDYKDSKQLLIEIDLKELEIKYIKADTESSIDPFSSYEAFIELGDYKDSETKAKKVALEIAKDYESKGKNDEALEWYYRSDEMDHLKAYMYSYVKDHLDNNDWITYDYLTILVDANYMDSKGIYNELYKVSYKIIVNDSLSDTEKDFSGGKTKTGHPYLHILIEGGYPEQKFNLNVLHETKYYDTVKDYLYDWGEYKNEAGETITAVCNADKWVNMDIGFYGELFAWHRFSVSIEELDTFDQVYVEFKINKPTPTPTETNHDHAISEIVADIEANT